MTIESITSTQIDEAITWQFKAHEGVDGVFHSLISRSGVDIIMALDRLATETPIEAARKATHIYLNYVTYLSDKEQELENTKALMSLFAEKLKPNIDLIKEDQLLPPSAIYEGLSLSETPKG